MKDLTAKEINVGLSKKGWGIEEFQKNYGYADVEELKEALGRVFSNPKNVNQAIKNMKNNSKRNQKRNNNSMLQVSDENEDEVMYISATIDSMVAALPANTLYVTNAIQKAEENIQKYEAQTHQKESSEMFEVAKNVADVVSKFPMDTAKGTVLDFVVIEKKYQQPEKTESEDSVETDNISRNENQLEVLKSKLNFMDEQIMSSESTKKALYAHRRAASKNVDEIYHKLKEFEAQVRNHRQMFEDAYLAYSENEKQISQEKAHLNELQLERENVMSQIRELTAISLYCGELDDTEKTFDYKLAEQNIENSKINDKVMSFFESELSDTGLLDDFAVSALKFVAKIIIACETIEEEASNSVELLFDNKSNVTDLLEFIGKKVKIIS